MKEILTKRRKLDDHETVMLTHDCSVILQNKLPPKLKAPGSFTIPCIIGESYFDKALCDLGASINLMPYSVFKKLGLGECKPTSVSLQLADRSITYPRGIVEDVLVKVDKFFLPADFIILDMEEDQEISLILGRPFLAIGEALINVAQGKMTFRVMDEQVAIDVFRAVKHPYAGNTCFHVDIVDQLVDEFKNDSKNLSKDEECELNGYEQYVLSSDWSDDEDDQDILQDRKEDEVVEESSLINPVEGDSANDMIMVEKEIIDDLLIEEVAGTWLRPLRFEELGVSRERSVPSIQEPPKLELKQLPIHLKYAFLGEQETLPIIISAKLSQEQEKLLIEVLRKHKEAIGWTIADIHGIHPSICMHRILMEAECKPTVQPQRRLNPTLKEVVKKEILKLLDAGIIYPISDSKWVSPIQVVPNKGGMTVVKSEQDELIPTHTVTGWRVCIDYRKLNDATRKDHFPLPFIDQMLERMARHEYYCFLNGY